MKIQIGNKRAKTSNGSKLLAFGGKAAQLELDDACITIEARTAIYYLWGEFYYARIGGGVERFRKETVIDQLTRILNVYRTEDISDIVEGEYIGVAVDRCNPRIAIFADQFNRRPLFYSFRDGVFLASDSLPDIVGAASERSLDQVSLYNFLLLGYAPGRETFYSGVSKLGADETLSVTPDGFRKLVTRRPKAIRDYSRQDIDRYEDLIVNAVQSRASTDINVVMNSGGWDSTTLVYLLQESIGREHVRSIVFDVRLKNEQSFNLYEVDKVRRISEYYGIETDTCVIDYGDKRSIDIWERSTPALRDSNTYFWLHHMQLADQIARTVPQHAAVFSGEASDSIHNFGYSQWVSVNYDSMQLREMADKAKSYLYGPTFFQRVCAGTHDQDEVFRFFRHYYGAPRFVATAGLSKDQLVRRYFEAFVLSYPRVPFASWQSEALTQPSLVNAYDQRIGSEYFDPIVREASAESLYFYLLQFYRAFHFQSAQIGVSQVAMARHGMSCRMPFLDMQMVDYMYSMPESWGRGLELRPTKYPLRHLAVERWDLPLHILEEPGPHSYIAENDKKWTYAGGQWDIYCEILFDSVFSGYFKDTLGRFHVEDHFDPKSFNVGYINRVVSDYVGGKQDIPNHGLLFKLALLSSIGVLG